MRPATPLVCLWQTRLQHALRVVHHNDHAFLIGVIRKKMKHLTALNKTVMTGCQKGAERKSISL